jgi:hypothetical protein
LTKLFMTMDSSDEASNFQQVLKSPLSSNKSKA